MNGYGACAPYCVPQIRVHFPYNCDISLNTSDKTKAPVRRLFEPKTFHTGNYQKYPETVSLVIALIALCTVSPNPSM